MPYDNRVVVLRLGHRPVRDKRVTTHLGLVARSFGASELILSTEDKAVVDSIRDVNKRWGGDFFVRLEMDWQKFLKSWQGVIVHLTMYGISVDDMIEEIRNKKDSILVVVGAEKIPPQVYKQATFNISIGSQPHSEVAALAIFLDRYFMGEQLKRDFSGDTKIIPSERRKKVIIKKRKKLTPSMAQAGE